MTDILEITRELLMQDNASTKHPIYVVQQLRRVYGLDVDHADHFIWSDDEGNDYEDDDSSLPEKHDFDRVGIDDIYEHVQSFFTRAGAEKYLEENAHNLNDPKIWVDSGHRNAEWITVREHLMSGGYSNKEERKEPFGSACCVSCGAKLELDAAFERLKRETGRAYPDSVAQIVEGIKVYPKSKGEAASEREALEQRVRLAVNEWCSCGGRGPDDDEACSACHVLHMVFEDEVT